MSQHDFRVERLVRLALRIVTAAVFRVRVRGVENLPPSTSGGWIVAGVPHRNWVEPALLLSALPLDRRVTTVADARTVLPSWWRRRAASVVGGAIAVGRDARARSFRGHVDAAGRVLAGGGVLMIFPEVGPPSRPPALRRLASGVARLAATSGAEVVPVVFGGTHELYLGRRIEVRVLPPIAPPAVDAGRSETATWMADFHALVQAEAAAAHARADARRPVRRHWRWLTGRYPRA